VLYLSQDYGEAEQYFNRLLAVRPDVSSRVYRALALWGMGRLGEAEQMLRLAGDSPQVKTYPRQIDLARKAGGAR
jgi:uncharacterized protein HemY